MRRRGGIRSIDYSAYAVYDFSEAMRPRKQLLRTESLNVVYISKPPTTTLPFLNRASPPPFQIFLSQGFQWRCVGPGHIWVI